MHAEAHEKMRRWGPREDCQHSGRRGCFIRERIHHGGATNSCARSICPRQKELNAGGPYGDRRRREERGAYEGIIAKVGGISSNNAYHRGSPKRESEARGVVNTR